MDSNKYFMLLVILIVWLVAGTGCHSSRIAPEQKTQPEPTATAFIGIPETSPPLVQSENESVEEFVARLAITKIAYNEPAFIALTSVKDQEDLYRGVSTDRKDIQKCWMYQESSMTACHMEDLESSYRIQSLPIIYFAFASSSAMQSLVIIDHYHWSSEQDPIDGYRLVIETAGNKWIEKSLIQVY
jgi:hypothetical protein